MMKHSCFNCFISLLSSASIVSLLIVNGLLAVTSASCRNYGRCPNRAAISYPFWIDNVDEPDYCGYPGLSLTCADEDRGEGRPVMNISNHLYYVQNINYHDGNFTFVDIDIDGNECPRPGFNVSLETKPLLDYDLTASVTIFYNCTIDPKDKRVQRYHLSCLDSPYNSARHSYAFLAYEISNGFNWYGNCQESVVVQGSRYSLLGSNYTNTKKLKLGFDLRWSASTGCKDCELSGGNCSFSKTTGALRCFCPNRKVADRICTRGDGLTTEFKVLLGVAPGVGALLVVLLYAYRRFFFSLYSLIIYWTNKFKGTTNVDIFLENYGNLGLQRYTYSNIKKMTNSFKDPLGQGGYGCVFRGKLNHDGGLVAVKILNESKGNGDDFINEVATIGRTNHVNVVNLLGFCTEGPKRALVYEFMPNGSLERFIYNEKTSAVGSISPLGWEKLYQITLGIARGLDYLHRGCNTRILHFDIKPHNILLDQDFCPKISDFGLAKLCPTRESIVSLAGARGTMGYIAPEVCCRNLGGVSHKSDVYSYGMMVLEMIGGRKNIDVTVANISEIYFPQWIYNHLKQGGNVKGSNEIEVDGSQGNFKHKLAEKMIIVALWCIQTHPSKRPSISKVVEMLEGNTEELQMPPDPSLDPNSVSSSSSS